MQFNGRAESKVGLVLSFVIGQFRENKTRVFTVLGVLIVIGVAAFLIISRIQKYDVSASDRYSQGYGNLLAGNQQQGVTMLEELIKIYPNTPAAYEARLILSDYGVAQENFAQALNYVYEVSKKGKPKTIRPIGLYRAIYIYDQTNDIDNAIKNSNEFIKNYKEHYLVRDVYANLARFYLIKQNSADAKRIYNEILTKFPATDEAILATRMLESIQ
ncbi:MAG: tetratricopeptide repeat protein [Elusimicrobiota bacterium]|jgi:TolA-binding protein|nr:tetratricopeptide repeat protein [Elusimicrobiota bacterium]